MVTFAEREK